jgi:uroporphyrin-III C-methyltransferase/precorrin-2 dehydrogenase/sirohydrochlorin ferrochelatase
VTAHGADGKLPSDIDWASVADPATTTVVYMPKRALAELAEMAQARGLAGDMPAIAVVAATRPEQDVIAGTIADIAARFEAAAPDGPVLVMIGRALAQAAQDRRLLTSSQSALPPRSPASSVPSRTR